jgi:hypothetical protein
MVLIRFWKGLFLSPLRLRLALRATNSYGSFASSLGIKEQEHGTDYSTPPDAEATIPLILYAFVPSRLV